MRDYCAYGIPPDGRLRQSQRIRNANGNATPTEMYGEHLPLVIHLLVGIAYRR